MTLRIRAMLRAQQRPHISFHTPGHKRAGADITELSYSDCLSDPHGVLRDAEADAAEILGAARSFFLTDGSTSGVFSMLWAAKRTGVSSVAVPAFSHPSVFHACEVMGLKVHTMSQDVHRGIPVQPTAEAIGRALSRADALLLTSPDYYGFFAPLNAARTLAEAAKKLLLIDGAHGAHLHFTEAYAGRYADLWVDGVHKSLPAMTQGAVVSARTEALGDLLREGVLRFRTTSPSYPILASVEYAVKYPRNLAVERAAEAFKMRHGCVKNDDWSKLLFPVGEQGARAQALLEHEGVYPEFYDGNYLMFYLSPCTRLRELRVLGELLETVPHAAVSDDAAAGTVPMYKETP